MSLQFRADARILAVGARHHHQLDEVLDVPRVAELGRQPIEQLGVRWWLALSAEVVHDAAQAVAEELLPQCG